MSVSRESRGLEDGTRGRRRDTSWGTGPIQAATRAEVAVLLERVPSPCQHVLTWGGHGWPRQVRVRLLWSLARAVRLDVAWPFQTRAPGQPAGRPKLTETVSPWRVSPRRAA